MIEIKITVDNIDYGDVVEQVLPQMIEHLSKQDGDNLLLPVLDKLQGLSGKVLKAAISVLPQEKRDELAVHLISTYRSQLIEYIGEAAKSKNIELDVVDLQAVKD